MKNNSLQCFSPLWFGKILKTTCLTAIFSIHFLFAPAKMPPETGSKPVFQSKVIFPEQNKHVHSSAIVELSNGDLLSCWFEGSGERTANDVVIKGARLKKGMQMWSQPFILADTPDHPDCNPTLFIDGKGRLHLVWVVVVANQWENSLLKTRISSDYLNDGPPRWEWQDVILLKPGEAFANTLEEKFKEAKTPELAWAAYAPQYEKQIVEAAGNPLKRETGWMPRIKPLILPSGRILLPLYSDGYNLSLVAVSDDHGDSWKPSLPIVGRGNIQPAIIRKKDGLLLAFMRDNGDSPGRIMVSESADEGINWSAAQKTPLPNPGASIDAITLNDGNLLMVYNDLENGRHRLAVSLSDDEGETWKWTKHLENNPDGGFSYPTAIQTKDGLVHISYSSHLKTGKTIKHVAFAPNWIKENPGGITNAEKLGFPKGRKILLLHMDDLGMCPEANQAGEYYIENGYVSSGAVMMPCPSANDFVEWAKKHPGADIGVHLTLTSEWKSYRWPTLTDPGKVPGLIDPEGKMYRSVQEVVINASPREVEIEIRAQIDRMLALGLNPTHIDTHMGTLYGSPAFVEVFLKTAEAYRIPANAIDLSNPEVAQKYRDVGYPVNEEVIGMINAYQLPKLDNFTSVPDGKTYELKRANFLALVNSLNEGLTEIIFHPSVETDKLKSITGSWQQRAWEAQLFADPVVVNYFRYNGILLTTWREVMEKFNAKSSSN
ncbi:exo-alpha-sialidase [Gaoshiqia sp. Z1-71]|uniref:exo-alpha-sialidase n=1 Tax=Gaoshiqia hydrogeniformans TaxID=3290090 RepID=UPI003BF81E98